MFDTEIIITLSRTERQKLLKVNENNKQNEGRMWKRIQVNPFLSDLIILHCLGGAGGTHPRRLTVVFS